jgi:hypothetical protein
VRCKRNLFSYIATSSSSSEFSYGMQQVEKALEVERLLKFLTEPRYEFNTDHDE